MKAVAEMTIGEVAAHVDRQCLEQAIMVVKDAEVDLAEVERWSRHEGMGEEFEQIRGLFREQQH